MDNMKSTSDLTETWIREAMAAILSLPSAFLNPFPILPDKDNVITHLGWPSKPRKTFAPSEKLAVVREAKVDTNQRLTLKKLKTSFGRIRASISQDTVSSYLLCIISQKESHSILRLSFNIQLMDT